jgi:hypothetical protein
MTLQFLLPDVPGALGVYQIDTSSFNSIVNINSSLELIKACGRVSMIPLILKLVPQQVQPEGKKKTIHVLELVSPYTFTELLQLTGRSPKDIFLLPAAEEPPDDLFPPEVIGDEDNQEAESPTDAPSTARDKTEAPAAPADKPPAAQENPLKAWAEVVELFKEVKPDEKRVQAWWRSACRLEVTSADFKRKSAPEKFGATMIITFRDKLKALKEEQAAQIPF